MVAADDYLDDFLLTKEDANKKKGEIVVQKLSEMNPYAKISYSETKLDSLREFLSSQKFSAVVFGIQGSFEEAIKINELTRELFLPFYGLNSSGLNAFFYSDLASENFEF